MTPAEKFENSDTEGFDTEEMVKYYDITRDDGVIGISKGKDALGRDLYCTITCLNFVVAYIYCYFNRTQAEAEAKAAQVLADING